MPSLSAIWSMNQPFWMSFMFSTPGMSGQSGIGLSPGRRGSRFCDVLRNEAFGSTSSGRYSASYLFPDGNCEFKGVDAICSKEDEVPATWDVPVIVLLFLLLFLLPPLLLFLLIAEH